MFLLFLYCYLSQCCHAIWKTEKSQEILKLTRKVIEFQIWPKSKRKIRKFHKIDWLAIANGENFTGMLEAECKWFELRIAYMWFFHEFTEMHEILTFQFTEIHESFIWLMGDFAIINISYCEILKTLHCQFRIFGSFLFKS